MSTATATPVEAGTTWTTDAIHSDARFAVRHFGLTWLRGGFDPFTLTLNANEHGELSLVGGADVKDINFSNEHLVGHLLGPDFFDAQLHPRVEFTSTSVTLAESGDVTVNGELTMRGTTKPVVLTGNWTGPVEGMASDLRFGLELRGEVDRFDFGIAWDAKLSGGQDVVSPKVRLEGEFELVKA